MSSTRKMRGRPDLAKNLLGVAEAAEVAEVAEVAAAAEVSEAA
jgi:hypothetical protein